MSGRRRVLVTPGRPWRERPLPSASLAPELAVPWHPEMAFERDPLQLAPFAAFARAAGA